MGSFLSRSSRRAAALLVTTSIALLAVAVFAQGAGAKEAKFESLAPSMGKMTAVIADPETGLVYGQGNGTKEFFVYDPSTDVWTDLAPSPLESENDGGAAYLDGKIYVAYMDNGSEMAIYDIASNSWTTIASPIAEGTGDITAGDGRIYMASGENFISYDPSTEVTTPLAEPPSFAAAGKSGGFQSWGGLQFDGTKIYGHQGNGYDGFGVYDIGSNTWTELAPIANEEEGWHGAVAGSTLDPVTNTYLAYGNYGENNLYVYDIEAGTWSRTKLPFTEVEDGGMAYVSTPGHEGVYIVEGEEGHEFTRYTERNVTDLSTAMSASVVPTATGGEITYSIQVKNNGPELAAGVVLTDSLPAGALLISSQTSQGGCVNVAGPTPSCNIGVLANGGGAALTFKVKVGFGTVTNKVTVSSEAVDTNPGNDSASITSILAAPVVTPVAQCVVPKLKGLPLKGARKALQAADCKAGKVTRVYRAKVKKGKVIRGGNAQGTKLPAGTKVKLSVSRGAKPADKAKGKH